VTSSGQVLLAGQARAVIDAYVAQPLRASASRTLTTPTALRRRLTRIERDGFAVTMQEFSDDISSAAAPIRDDSGRTVAAMHVHGPAYRFPDGDRLAELVATLTAAAASVSTHRISGPNP
jgi:DNA-binding IclR family transcriptional regulator